MKIIEQNPATDGRFVLNDDEARALLLVFEKMDELISSQVMFVRQLNPNSEEFSLECARLDHAREQMEILSELRRQIWTFDFECDPDECTA